MSKKSSSVSAPVIITRYTTPSPVYRSPGVSSTQPNMAFSVSEILLKSRSGLTVPTVPNMDYHMDNELPDLRKLDIVERELLLEYVKQQVIDKEKALKEKLDLRRKEYKANDAKYKALLDFYETHKAVTDDSIKTSSEASKS